METEIVIKGWGSISGDTFGIGRDFGGINSDTSSVYFYTELV